MLSSIMLQPVDVLIALKLVLLDNPKRSYEELERETGIGSSSVHRSVQRLTDAGLVGPEREVKRQALLEFILHGVRYAYYVKPGEPTRGMPTAHAVPPLSALIAGGGEVPVWPDPEGTVRGYALGPLHKEAPKAAKRDPKLYELLALVDAIRIGRSRERKLAEAELRKRLEP